MEYIASGVFAILGTILGSLITYFLQNKNKKRKELEEKRVLLAKANISLINFVRNENRTILDENNLLMQMKLINTTLKDFKPLNSDDKIDKVFKDYLENGEISELDEISKKFSDYIVKKNLMGSYFTAKYASVENFKKYNKMV